MLSQDVLTKPQRLIIETMTAFRALEQTTRAYRQAEATRDLAAYAKIISGYKRRFPGQAALLNSLFDYEMAYSYATGRFSYASPVENAKQLHVLKTASNRNLLNALRGLIDESEWHELRARLAKELEELEGLWFAMVAWGLEIGTKLQNAHTELRRGHASDACKLASEALVEVQYKYAETVPTSPT